MLISLKRCLSDLLIQPVCWHCQTPEPFAPDQKGLCQRCWHRLGLKTSGLQGSEPLPWHAAGWYEAELRRMVLRLRTTPDASVLHSLCRELRNALAQRALLIPIPGWKAQARANPLPQLLCRSLQRPCVPVLKRCRPTVGQHHLNRRQRLLNQQGSFQVLEERHSPITPSGLLSWNGADVWLVDDIVTSGATAMAARDALQTSGIVTKGVICLARTRLSVTP